MKKGVVRIACAAAVFAFCVLFGGRGEVSANTKAEAEYVKLQQEVRGTLTAAEKECWYRTTISASGRLCLEFCPKGTGLNVELCDKSGNVWESVNAPDPVDGKLKYFYELKKGTYYYCVRVSGNQDSAAYAITPKFTSAQAVYEKNTTKKKAKKLILTDDIELKGHIAQNAAKEYFQFTFDRMSEIGISIHAKEKLMMTLYNSDGYVICSCECPITSDYFADWKIDWDMNYPHLSPLLYPGTYYLEISGGKSKDSYYLADSYGNYELQIDLRDESDGTLELETDSAEYTGKTIAIPGAVLKNAKGQVIDPKRYRLELEYLSGEFSFAKRIKKIGRYYIKLDSMSVSKDDELQWMSAGHMFTVYPKQGKLRSVKGSGSGRITVRMERNAASTGYQIQVASDKKFKNIVKDVRTKSVKKSIASLKGGKKYYVRIRNYKTIRFTQGEAWATEDLCGRWSKVRTAVCK